MVVVCHDVTIAEQRKVALSNKILNSLLVSYWEKSIRYLFVANVVAPEITEEAKVKKRFHTHSYTQDECSVGRSVGSRTDKCLCTHISALLLSRLTTPIHLLR